MSMAALVAAGKRGQSQHIPHVRHCWSKNPTKEAKSGQNSRKSPARLGMALFRCDVTARPSTSPEQRNGLRHMEKCLHFLFIGSIIPAECRHDPPPGKGGTVAVPVAPPPLPV